MFQHFVGGSLFHKMVGLQGVQCLQEAILTSVYLCIRFLKYGIYLVTSKRNLFDPFCKGPSCVLYNCFLVVAKKQLPFSRDKFLPMTLIVEWVSLIFPNDFLGIIFLHKFPAPQFHLFYFLIQSQTRKLFRNRTKDEHQQGLSISILLLIYLCTRNPPACRRV